MTLLPIWEENNLFLRPSDLKKVIFMVISYLGTLYILEKLFLSKSHANSCFYSALLMLDYLADFILRYQ